MRRARLSISMNSNAAGNTTLEECIIPCTHCRILRRQKLKNLKLIMILLQGHVFQYSFCIRHTRPNKTFLAGLRGHPNMVHRMTALPRRSATHGPNTVVTVYMHPTRLLGYSTADVGLSHTTGHRTSTHPLYSFDLLSVYFFLQFFFLVPR